MVFTGWTTDRDPRQEFRAHRCKGSLENNVSIRYYGTETVSERRQNKWLLLDAEWYAQSFTPLEHSMPIRFCPFCGKRLWPMVLAVNES